MGRLRRILAIDGTPTLLPGIALLAVILVPVAFGPLLIPVDRTDVLAAEPNLAPSLAHPLGTQSEGRDVLALLVYGLPVTLRIGLLAGAIAVAIGTVLGLVSGYLGGLADGAIRGAVDVGLTIPPLAILILIASSFRAVGVETIAVVVSLTLWMYTTRVVRAQVLSLRERGFVALARLSGAGAMYIMFHEILPNLLPFLAATFVSSVSSAILVAIGLEVLGLGLQDTQTLGTTIYYAIYYTAIWRGLWWWWLPPIVLLVLIFLSLFLISVALDARANPRLRGAAR